MPRRYRRNFELTSPPPHPSVSTPLISLTELTPMGLVINPKTKEPVLAVTDGEYISLRSLKEENILARIGRGYLADKQEAVVDFTHYPRSHTPEGVTIKGMGYGTSLYTAIGLGVHLAWHSRLELQMYKPRRNEFLDGISSFSNDRTVEADRWWESARRLGLTDKETAEFEEVEEGVEVRVDADDLNRIVSLDEGEITYVNDVNVDITKSEERIYDTYPYSNADDHHLIAAAFPLVAEGPTLKDFCLQLREDATSFFEPDQTALLAIDVRGLSIDALTLVTLAYLAADLGDAEVDALQYRWAHGLDPGTASPQLRLFTPNQTRAGDLESVLEARQEAGWSAIESLP